MNFDRTDLFVMVIAQVIGFLGMASMTFSFQFRQNKKLFLAQFLGNICFFIQFFLLGAYTGCVSQLISMPRNFFLARGESWMKSRIWIPVFIGLQAVMTVLTWGGPLSLLPLVTCIAQTLSGWSFHPGIVRLVNLLINSPCWLVYDFLTGSIAGTLNEIFTEASVLISIRRYGWRSLWRGEEPGREGLLEKNTGKIQADSL